MNNGSGVPWELPNSNGTACGIFATEISAITSMIKNAQEAVVQANIANTNQNAEIKTLAISTLSQTLALRKACSLTLKHK